MPSEADRELALQGWMRSQAGLPLKKSHRAALQRCKVQGQARRTDWRIAKTGLVKRLARIGRSLPAGVDLEQRSEVLLRSLSAVQGTAGGVTIPEGFVTSLEVNMLAFGGILNVADVLRTASGNDMLWPTADDTSNEGEILGESVQQNTADPSFKGVTFRAYKFSSKMVKVPYELLEDSAFDLAIFLGQILGERLGRAQNRKFTVGTGASEPKGIVTAATLGITSAASGAIADTELIRLQHSVDPAYRNGAAFMMHDNVILAIRQLKDLQGRFIWQPGLVDGAPDRLLNSPVVVNQHMDSTVATTKKTVLYGQLSKYKVRQVNNVRMRRLDERYAEYDQVAFLGLVRADGNLIDAGTAPVKYLVQV
jgi:HK97 family phage major capsid protein